MFAAAIQRRPARNPNIVFQNRVGAARSVAELTFDARILLRQPRQSVDFDDATGLDDTGDGDSSSDERVLMVEREPKA
jgi:hypothetical protein